MHISIFDLFSIGIGPSSSHTVGPMRAAYDFIQRLAKNGVLEETKRLQVELYGSLALTGIGHGTDTAVLMGLAGEIPEAIVPSTVAEKVQTIEKKHKINLGQQHTVKFKIKQDLLFHTDQQLPKHANGMRFTAFAKKQQILLSNEYYSIGGGFIISDEEQGLEQAPVKVPHPFANAQELITLCREQQLTIAELMLKNEMSWHSQAQIHHQLLTIANIMQNCIEAGCQTHGMLPGPLNIKRRAAPLYEKLVAQKHDRYHHHDHIMNWINLFAMAVNEENAAGGRIVTAPTNGAAGIIPAVLQYYKDFCEQPCEMGVINFLLTAGAIAILYKKGASISGAEVGCQGEVGVASSMAAGALCAVLGGSLRQVENAAEIAMEHHLGMTCDPVGGLVQIPCIERNAMGAIKAINAAHLALLEDRHNKVSLDKVIATMHETGKNMLSIYKETSQGGLAVNVTEC